MIIAAAIIAALALGVSATALLGRPRTPSGIAGQFALTLPLVAVSGAVGLSSGMGLTGALIAAFSVGLAVIIPAFLPEAEQTGPDGAGRAAASWVGGFCTTVIMAALLLSWTASIIQFATPLNRSVVVIVLGVAAAAAARGPGAARVWNLILWIAAVVSAVLLLAAQAFIGAPSAALHPIVDTTTEPVLPLAAFTLVVLIIGIGTPGIRAAAHRDRDGVVLAGVIAAVVTGVVLVALLMATGGWLTTADFSLFVILNFVPWWVGTIVAALMALAALVGVSRALRDAWTLDPGMRALVATPAPGGHAWLRRTYPLFTLVVIAIIAIAPVPQVLVAVLAAVFAVIAIVANRTLGTDAATEPGASSESSESLVEADSPAAT